jgi:hypothetical protein
MPSHVVAGSVVILSLLALASCAAPPPPVGCDGTSTLQVGEEASPICDVEQSLAAVGGRIAVEVRATLPANARYGSGRDVGSMSVFVTALDSPWQQAHGTLDLGPPASGMSLSSEYRYLGPCELQRRADVLASDCALANHLREAVRVVGDLPAPTDPEADPSISWLEADYVFTGDYSASATVRSAIGVDDERLLSIALEDGGLLTIFPLGNDFHEFATLVLRNEHTSSLDQPWLPDDETPRLGPCIVDLVDGPRDGSMRCAGDDTSSSGSTSVDIRWRPAD